jgi:hypothetical protein
MSAGDDNTLVVTPKGYEIDARESGGLLKLARDRRCQPEIAIAIGIVDGGLNRFEADVPGTGTAVRGLPALPDDPVVDLHDRLERPDPKRARLH